MRKKLVLFTMSLSLFSGFDHGTALAARYVDNHDGTVTDTQTKLMWQQTVDEQGVPWDEVSSYCGSRTTGGHSDWRAPRVDELLTIVDYTRWNQAIDPVFHGFPGLYWSNSTYARDPPGAWCVYFDTGHLDTPSKDSALYVRCVRRGPFWSFHPSNHLKVQTKESVKDTFLGYVWQKSDDGRKRTWAVAQTYCSNLHLDGYTDWRLPTIDELQTIIDYTVWNPALSTAVLNGRSDGYWSSSTHANDSDDVWRVDFYDGHVYPINRYYDFYVRCLRTGLATLTLSKSGTGNGKVISSPVGINCGSDCTEKFEKSMKIKLVAKANAGSVFSGWSGGGCTGFGAKPCTVAITKNTIVTAKFNKISPDCIDDENDSVIDYEN